MRRYTRVEAMIIPWPEIIRRIVKSVEAPDYDTRVPRASRIPLQLIMVGFVAFAVTALFSVWWVGDSTGWLMVGFMLAFYTPYLVGQYFTEIRRISGPEPLWDSDEALIVRAAAIAGDDRIAPPAQTQPAMSVDRPEGTDSLCISGLNSAELVIPLDSSRVSTRELVMESVTGAFLIGVSFIARIGHETIFTSWQIGILGGILLAQSLWGLRQRLRMSQPLSVVVDAHGLTWRRGGKLHILPWSAAHALCMIELPPFEAPQSRPADATQRIYWIQGSDGALIWTPTPRGRWSRVASEASAPQTASDPAWMLCALAAQRTGLPLRDLTASAARLAQLRPRVNLIRQALEPASSVQISEADQRRIATERARLRKQAWRVLGLGVALDIIMLAAAATLFFAAPRVYGDQLAQAQRSRPIYADSLATLSDQWTVRDGVIEVTLHQVSDQVGDFDLAEAGLVLRADPTTHEALVFTITPGGGWRLARFSLKADGNNVQEGGDLIYEGLFIPVSAIHRGTDTTNRLAVIMRGASYTFFVNSQYVGSYHDDRVAGEQVGLYTDGLGQATEFTDFAVYPAPPTLIAY